MSELKASEQEVLEAVLKNPIGYYSAIHEQGLEKFKQMLTAQGNHVHGILSTFSEELSIYRALEIEMRYDTITPDSMKEYFSKLDQFRERKRAEIQQRS